MQKPDFSNRPRVSDEQNRILRVISGLTLHLTSGLRPMHTYSIINRQRKIGGCVNDAA